MGNRKMDSRGAARATQTVKGHRSTRRQFLAQLTVLIGASTVGYGATPAAAGQPKSGGVLRAGLNSTIQNLDFHRVRSLGDKIAPWNIFGGLTALDYKTMRYVPDIAENLETASDGMSWTFKIRKGIRFHNGRELTAEDIKFSIDRIRDPRTAAPDAGYYANVDSVQVVDSNTARFLMKRPDALIPEAVWVSTGAIMPKEAVATMNTQPVGSGPFMFAENVPMTRTVLKKFPDYWQKPYPYLNEIQLMPVPEASSRVAALKSGELDWIQSVPVAQVADLQKTPGVNVVIAPSSAVDYAYINNLKPPLDNVKVRQAIAHAINRDSVIKKVHYGLGAPAYIAVPAVSAVKINVEPLPYDPARAKQLIAEAGVRGFELPILAHNVNYIAQLTESIVADLQAVGINAKVVQTEDGLWIAKTQAKDYMMATSTRVSGIDPHLRTYRWFGSASPANLIGYSKPAIDDLLQKGVATADLTKRSEIYTQIWKILIQDASMLYITTTPQVVAMRSYVKDYDPYPEGNTFFKTTWLDK